MLSVVDLCVAFEGRPVLDRVSFDVATGEVGELLIAGDGELRSALQHRIAAHLHDHLHRRWRPDGRRQPHTRPTRHEGTCWQMVTPAMPPSAQRGSTMIEVLVTLVIIAFGLLGLATVLGLAGILWVNGRHASGVRRERYRLRAQILAGLALAWVLTLARLST